MVKLFDMPDGYCVYQATLNGKVYIGKAKNFYKRWGIHKVCGESYYFARALRKHGWMLCQWEILATTDSEKNALKLEMEFIAKARLAGQQLYNMTDGGEGSSGLKMSAEHRRKLIAIRSKLTPKQRDEIRQQYSTGDFTIYDLAEIFNVTGATISRTINNNQKQDRTERNELIRELYYSGLTAKEISKKIGISDSTVGYQLKRLVPGYPIRERNRVANLGNWAKKRITYLTKERKTA